MGLRAQTETGEASASTDKAFAARPHPRPPPRPPPRAIRGSGSAVELAAQAHDDDDDSVDEALEREFSEEADEAIQAALEQSVLAETAKKAEQAEEVVVVDSEKAGLPAGQPVPAPILATRPKRMAKVSSKGKGKDSKDRLRSSKNNFHH